MKVLQKWEYQTILPLLSTIHSKLVTYPILNQSFEGEVWIDAYPVPESVYVWDKKFNHFFFGSVENEVQMQNWKIFFQKKIDRYLGESIKWFNFYYSEIWNNILDESIWKKFKTKINTKRTLFEISSQEQLTEEVSIPNNVKIIPVTADILKKNELYNLKGLIEELNHMWTEENRFFNYGFGYCAITDKAIAGWCLGEYFNDQFNEKFFGVGIETYPEFQRQNIGTALGQHLIRIGLEKNYKIYWECSKDNKASIKTAEKIGFKLISEYDTVYASLIK